MRSKHFKSDIIRGAGGGDGGGSQSSTPVEQPDSLHSRDTAYLLDGLCEGEIEGLIDGLKSVLLDDTPVQNPNGTYNFKNLTVYSTKGTQGQPYIPMFAAIESETPYSVKISNGVPVTRSLINANANALRVRLSTPAMFAQDSSGNTNGTTIAFKIEVQNNGGGYVEAVNDSFSGKTTTKYDRAYKIPLTGTGPWDIRITKLTADSASPAMRNDLYLESIAGIIDQKLSMPNTALVGLSIDARVFPSIPRRAYRIRGMRMKVPANYDPVLRTYSGVWDGTFRIAYTNNPAWCYYDLCTAERYGLGRYIDPALVNKWWLYTIGQYCDAMVPDGYGGTEPRFTLNCHIQTRAEAFNVLNSLASAFRGMTYWESGQISAVQDAPSDPVSLFTRANVIGGEFNYSGVARRARHTVALVTWNDPSDGYRQKVEYVQDEYMVARYGVIQADIVAFGCTSRGQAHRVGKWLLYTERFESETVTFKAALDSAYLRPGKVISIQDAHRAGKRFSGRLASSGSTDSLLVIDAAIDIEAGKTYIAHVVLPDGSVANADVVNAPGSTASLALAAPLAAVPLANAVWAVSASDLATQTFRVLSAAETAKNEYSITALKHYPAKYDLVENNVALHITAVSGINTTAPASPQNLSIAEDLVRMQGIVRSRMMVTWDTVVRANAYRVSWRSATGNWNLLPDTLAASVEVIDPPVGSVEVRVQAVGVMGLVSAPVTASMVLLGKTAPPADVVGFIASRKGNDIYFSWNPVPDEDLHHYEIRLGGVWDTALEFLTTPKTSDTKVSPQGGTFLIRAVDTSGNFSRNSASFALGANTDINVVVLDDDAGYGWPGVLTDMVHDGADITLAYAKSWDDLTLPWDSYIGSWMLESQPLTSGNYVTDVHDMGRVIDATFSVEPQLDVIPLGTSWKTWNMPWSSYGNNWTWFGPSGAVSAVFEIDTSPDNITWTGWQPFVPGLRTCRYYKMRASFVVQTNFQIRFNHFPITVDVPDRLERFPNEAIPLAGKTINFNPPFTAVDAVSVTLLNGAAGDTVTVAKTVNSITVNIFDSTNAAKAGTADIVVPGY